jgi:phosphoribosylpyrophosphate synthetase
MIENGAKSVRAIASHAIVSDPASSRVETVGFDRDDLHGFNPLFQVNARK